MQSRTLVGDPWSFIVVPFWFFQQEITGQQIKLPQQQALAEGSNCFW